MFIAQAVVGLYCSIAVQLVVFLHLWFTISGQTLSVTLLAVQGFRNIYHHILIIVAVGVFFIPVVVPIHHHHHHRRRRCRRRHVAIIRFALSRGVDPYGTGGTRPPNIWTRGHYHECPPQYF